MNQYPVEYETEKTLKAFKFNKIKFNMKRVREKENIIRS